MKFQQDLEIARKAARAAAAAAIPFFEGSVEAELKPDSTPVTAADRASEEAILSVIEKKFPDDAIAAEESGVKDGSTGRRWIIDPLDGTKPFLRKLPYWSVIIALEVDGVVEAGVVRFPAIDLEFAAAAGTGCLRNGSAVRCGSEAEISRAIIQVGEWSHVERLSRGEIGRIAGEAWSLRCYGDAMGGCLVLAGKSDAWIEAGIRAWDVGPFPILAREAGAVFTDWNGQPSISSGTALLANPALHKVLQARLKAAG